MEKYRIIANEDMYKGPHTWQSGLDYELVEGNTNLTLASDQGQTVMRLDEKEQLKELFNGIK